MVKSKDRSPMARPTVQKLSEFSMALQSSAQQLDPLLNKQKTTESNLCFVLSNEMNGTPINVGISY